MAAHSTTFALGANCGSGESFRDLSGSGSPLPLREIIAEVCQRLWPAPAKPDFELALRTKLTDRACRSAVNGTSTLSGESLASLIRSEEGLEFLTAIMADATPKWWVSFQQQSTMHNARRKAARLQRVIQETMHAVDETAAAIARAETAMAVQDEEFYRPHVSALRATARVHGGAMAQATKGRR